MSWNQGAESAMTSTATADSRLKKLDVSKLLVEGRAFLALAVIIVVFTILSPNYLTVNNVLIMSSHVAIFALLSLGMLMVVLTGGIDLSVGSTLGFSAVVGGYLLKGVPIAMFGVTLYPSVPVAVLISVVGLQPFISTLVMMLAGRGLAKVITGGQNTAASNETFRWIANGYVLGLPVVFLLAVLIVIAVGLLVRRSALGLMIEAIGMDPRAARLAGVNRRGLLFAVYIASGALAAVAGIFASASVMTVDVSNTGYQLEMDAILAVVIGGTSLAGGKFNITGAAIGALLIATLDKTVVFLGISSSATPAFKAIVIIALCLLQSDRVRAMFRARRSLRSTPRSSDIPKEAVSA